MSDFPTNPFSEICKRHGLSVTPQRKAIYDELVKSPNHPTTEELYEIVCSQVPNISMDTVYRTLSTFVEIGLANIVEGYGEVRRYDPDTKPHHHFRCIKCKKIIDFHHDRYNNLEIPDSIRELFTVSKIKVLLEGECRECRGG